MRRLLACSLPLAAVAGGLLLFPGTLRAQQAPARALTAPQRADSARMARADSARAGILRRLERLGRAPGADSLLFVQDSLAKAEASGAGSAGTGPDSVLTELMALKGYALTEYEGGRADFAAGERILVLKSMEGGKARVNREGMNVEADSSITFDENSGRVRTQGATTFTPPDGNPTATTGLIYDLEGQRGSAFNAKTTYDQGGAKWIISGDMPLAAADSSFMSHAIFTSCDLDVPHYHFEADEIKIVGKNVLVARPVRLYFADVPVAWFPFIAQSLSRGRASGLLTPRFSVNDIVRNSTGYRRRLSNLGFYWAMSEYSDGILALDWFSDNFIAATGSLNYRFNRQFLDGNLNLRQYWRRDGSTELALDTYHSWAYDERTQFRVSARYAKADFIRQYSFNPAEVTQSIDSEGGANRRFGWGSLSLSANRRQYMSDDRIEWTLPTANLSLSTVTLFRAPPNRAKPWNNMTVGGSASLSRRTVDKLQADTFDASKVDTEAQDASVRTTFSMGNLSLSQSLEMRENSTLGIPEAYLLLGDSAGKPQLVTGAPARSITDQDLRWTLSLGYMQQLIGSTTLTPSVSLSGNSFKSDTSAVASSFVGAPTRVSVGASLKTDLYGFFPGFGSYAAIRHKISPSLSWDWSPEVKPSELQKQVFRSRALQPTNGLSLSLNQTFEAKKTALDTASASPAEIVQLLGIRTSVIQYDFVEADSVGSFLSGFRTTRLTNEISSDFLQGLSVSVDHDLFEDVRHEDGSLDRALKPHLASVNFSFSLGSNSGIFRWLGLGGGEAAPAAQEEEQPAPAPTSVDEASIIPGVEAVPRGPQRASRGESAARAGGGWSANHSYALQRPRGDEAVPSQMLNGTVSLRPTPGWEVNWRTSYDLQRQAFNDHTIRLRRDLHRWQADFDFLQTATGNWQFRFEVSLMDNRDLKFDYQQRNLDVGRQGEAFR
ncbi:MAG: LPS-assembly protein LptD [Gemmatimonadetes bacterium]|nr:LPS-assembly protein LptD [Gemmatimonadota bacterium]